MDKLNFGQRVSFNKKLVRGWASNMNVWRERDFSGSGIFLGHRTLSNGVTYFDGEVSIYEPKEYIRVALVAFNATCNPVYVPLTEIKYEK